MAVDVIARGMVGKSEKNTVEKIDFTSNAMTFGTVATTERFEGCTRILNPLCLENASLIWGMKAKYVDEPRIVFESVFAVSNEYYAEYTHKYTHKGFLLFEKDSGNDPYELTIDNAPVKYEITDVANYQIYKSRNYTLVTSHIDIRQAIVIYDESLNVVDIIYSEQYRYIYDNESHKFTRTWTETAPTSASHITDVGLYPSSSWGSIKFSYRHAFESINDKNKIKPYISYYTDVQSLPEFYLIDDSLFEDAPYGLRIVATDGSGMSYLGPVVLKAEEEQGGTEPMMVISSVSNSHITTKDGRTMYTGSSDKDLTEIVGAFEQGRAVYAMIVGVPFTIMVQITGMANSTGDPSVINPYSVSGACRIWDAVTIDGVTTYSEQVISLFITANDGTKVYY